MTMRTQAKYFDELTELGRKTAQQIVDSVNEQVGKEVARIDETWLDYGQSWAWETIITYSGALDMTYQALNPRDFREMNEGNFSPESKQEMIKRLVEKATAPRI